MSTLVESLLVQITQIQVSLIQGVSLRLPETFFIEFSCTNTLTLLVFEGRIFRASPKLLFHLSCSCTYKNLTIVVFLEYSLCCAVTCWLQSLSLSISYQSPFSLSLSVRFIHSFPLECDVFVDKIINLCKEVEKSE